MTRSWGKPTGTCNGYAVDDDRGVCPAGWHVPTDEEWMELEMALGMSYEDAHDTGWRGTDQGSQLAGRADLWTNGALENNPAFGSSGFNALPGGYRFSNGSFAYGGHFGGWWSATEDFSYYAWSRGMYYNLSGVSRTYRSKELGYSVRCVSPVE